MNPAEPSPASRPSSFSLAVGIAASTVLAGITLLVFYFLRDYGPESVIHRFIVAAVSNDELAIAQTTSQPPGDPYSHLLARQVQAEMAQGADLKLFRMDRQPSIARATMGYIQGRQISPVIFVVLKKDGVWKLDTYATIVAVRQAFNMPIPRRDTSSPTP